MTTFVYQRGEPVTVHLVINDAAGYTPASLTVAMKVKPAVRKAPPPSSTAASATMTVTYTAASGDEEAYWTGTTSAVLVPGLYVVDAEIKSGSTVIDVTDFALIEIRESVTPS